MPRRRRRAALNINLMYADPVRLAAHGYIVAAQDVRGRYASDGEFVPTDRHCIPR